MYVIKGLLIKYLNWSSKISKTKMNEMLHNCPKKCPQVIPNSPQILVLQHAQVTPVNFMGAYFGVQLVRLVINYNSLGR